jgi:hypothetical protein
MEIENTRLKAVEPNLYVVFAGSSGAKRVTSTLVDERLKKTTKPGRFPSAFRA